MYRRSKRGPGCMIAVIIVGILIGAVYFISQIPAPSQGIALLPSSTPRLATLLPATSISTTIAPTTLPLADATSDASDNASVSLIVPSANVAAPVVHIGLGENGSWDVSQLGFNVGHLNGTGWLDKPGNMVLAGHVEMKDGTPGIFAHIAQLKAGDQAYLFVASQRRVYQIDSVADVAPDDLQVLYPTPNDRLTLITCGDYDFASNTYLQRVVVTAERIA